MDVKKAIIPIAGLGTRFLPLSQVLPKELFPLVDKPVLEYIIEEAFASGIRNVIFVIRPGKKIILDYFTNQKLFFKTADQNKPLGDGHAILQAKNLVKNEPFAVLFGDDIVESKTPCLKQLLNVFQKYQKPIVALYKVPKEKISSYGVIDGKKIGQRIYQIKKIVEKPSVKEAPSNLAIVGKYILTPQVFDYLSRAKPSKNGEIFLAESLQRMIENGQEVLGLEFEGKWLECGDKQKWLESFLYLAKKGSG